MSVERTSSGDMCINDVYLYYLAHDVPFGGVGPSGMGAYHGHHSYLTFSHQRGVMLHATWGDVAFRYPPYAPSKLKWVKRLMG